MLPPWHRSHASIRHPVRLCSLLIAASPSLPAHLLASRAEEPPFPCLWKTWLHSPWAKSSRTCESASCRQVACEGVPAGRVEPGLFSFVICCPSLHHHVSVHTMLTAMTILPRLVALVGPSNCPAGCRWRSWPPIDAVPPSISAAWTSAAQGP